TKTKQLTHKLFGFTRAQPTFPVVIIDDNRFMTELPKHFLQRVRLQQRTIVIRPMICDNADGAQLASLPLIQHHLVLKIMSISSSAANHEQIFSLVHETFPLPSPD